MLRSLVGSEMCIRDRLYGDAGWTDPPRSTSALAQISEAASARDVGTRVHGLVAQKLLSQYAGPGFEPELLVLLSHLMNEHGVLFHKAKPVREAATELLTPITTKIRPAAVPLALAPLYDGVSSRKWEIQAGALSAIGRLVKSKKTKVGVARELRSVIPVVSDQMSCTKLQVAELAVETMREVCGVCGNKDLAPFVEQIIGSVISPDVVGSCVHALASTVLVQQVDAPALAVVEPLLLRALSLNQTAMRRKVAVVVSNLASMVESALDAAPFVVRVLPALRASLERLSDLEAKSVTATAIQNLEQSEITLSRYGVLSQSAVEGVLCEICTAHQVPAIETPVVEFVAGMCCGLVGARAFEEKPWVECILPFLEVESDEVAKRVCVGVLESCSFKAVRRESAADLEEEGEDLCNCEFSLAYAAKTLATNTRLHLKKGKRYGLCGANGCGKSTLLRAIADGQLEGFPPPNELRAIHLEQDTQAIDSELTLLEFVFAEPMCGGLARERVVAFLCELGFGDLNSDSAGSNPGSAGEANLGAHVGLSLIHI
eukprot:TRINITY_DN27608_c0_g1_i2.p1 TRINITY_DN27608_c0_g1~~TRINITY_DN27608_c0_g1_i2.p1  ORF type:complete len:545 (-),score=158.45 TRINITY_DN27608_c0_g1_i2:139-1773(-)